MTSNEKLNGVVLIDCAKANASQGLSEAAQQCGYGQNTDEFLEALTQACKNAGIHFTSLDDLVEAQSLHLKPGVEIAPDTQSQL